MAEIYKLEELKQMKKLYSEGYSVRSISKIMNHSDQKSISRRLKTMGIKVYEQPYKKLNMKEKEIINLYNNGKSMKKIAKELGVSDGLIKRLLLRNNIPIINKSKRGDINANKKQIISLYESGNTIEKLSKLFKCDFEVIKRILTENEITIRPQSFYIRGKPSSNRINLPVEKVINLYNNGETITRISKLFNCDYCVVNRTLQDNDIKIRQPTFYLKGKVSSKKGKKFEELYWDKANEIREKIRLGTIEVMKNPEHRKRLGEIRKNGYKEGRIKKFIGEEHYNWQGGISFEPYPITFNKEFKNIVRLRDNFCCLNCGISEQKQIVLLGRKLTIHHVDYNKENTCLQNCCTLCLRCNTIANKNRNEWTEYYQDKLSKLYGYQSELLEVTN